MPSFKVPLATGDAKHSLRFSYSGLITAVERIVDKLGDAVDDSWKRELSRRFQEAAIGHLTQKLRIAMSLPEVASVKGVVVSGGVASNAALRAA
jgi:N6-L-threonylcarbamoyladenine synthase